MTTSTTATAAATPDDTTVAGDRGCLGVAVGAAGEPAGRGAGDGSGVADLPILDEVPLLGSAIALVHGIDRLVAQLLEVLIELQDHDVAEATTGVMLEQWLAIAGRRTGSDRRMLLTACDVLRRLPSLRIAFCQEGAVSWCQVRAVVLAVHRLPRALDDVIDGELSRTIDACRDADPDMLTSAVSRAARSWDPTPTRKAEEAAERDEFVALQPRLDGSGGQLFGELGPVSFATVDAALTPARRPDPAEHGEQAGEQGDAGDAHGNDAASEADPDEDDPRPRVRIGQHRARRLVQLCDASLTGGRTDAVPAGGTGHAGSATGVGSPIGAGSAVGAGSRPQLLVRIELASLLDRDTMPAELLTRLSGGKLWLDAGSARRLVEARGADLRAVVLDDCGDVVGVGRRNRIAPGWLADATLALHDTCSRPDCSTAARRCQVDHAVPWHPVRPQDPRGRTDIDQLAPLCDHHNTSKELSGWRVTQTADGTRRWTHQRSGLTTVTRPATWRPVGRSPACDPPGGLDLDDEAFGRDTAGERRGRYVVHRARGPDDAWAGRSRCGAHRPRGPDGVREHRGRYVVHGPRGPDGVREHRGRYVVHRARCPDDARGAPQCRA